MRFFSAILAGWLFCCVRAPAEQALANRIAAIVNDSIITLQDVYQACEGDIRVYSRTYFNQPELLDQKVKATLRDALQLLIDRQLIIEDFKSSGLNLPESYIDEEIKDQIRKRYVDRVTLTKTLRAQGRSYESFRQQARDDIILAAMEQKNIRSAILISPRKVETCYLTNLAKYKLDDQVKLRLIKLDCSTPSRSPVVLQRAREIRQKITEGAPFADMARVYSDGSYAKDGGLWGWREQSKLNKGLSAIAFSLPLDTPSKIIGVAREPSDEYWMIEYHDDGKPAFARKYSSKDEFLEEKKAADLADPGALPPPIEYYLLWVEDKQLAHMKPLEDVREEIEKELVLQERARLRARWIERLKQKSFVRIIPW